MATKQSFIYFIIFGIMGFITQQLPNNKSILAFKTEDRYYYNALLKTSSPFYDSITHHNTIIDPTHVKEVLKNLYNECCNRVESKIHSITSLSFYRLVSFLHDNSIQAWEETFFKGKFHDSFFEDFDSQEFAMSRRILKFLLDESVNVNMEIINEPQDISYLAEKYKSNLDEHFGYIYLLYQLAQYISEIDMVGSGVFIELENNMIIPCRTQQQNEKVEIINAYINANLARLAVDPSETVGLEEMKDALLSCLGIDYSSATTVIFDLIDNAEKYDIPFRLFGWESLPMSLETFDFDYEICSRFFNGLTLNKGNKLLISEIPLKPKNINRFFYRPILIWTIHGKEYCIITKSKYLETIIQLPADLIPWGKAPAEWLAIECFRKYVHKKEDEHDKWLDDLVEEGLLAQKIIFERNIESFKQERSNNIRISRGVGEIDYIIINEVLNNVFVVDCKNLQGRYDMVAFKDDYSNFTKKNGYDEKLRKKVKWVKENINIVNAHFNIKHGKVDVKNYNIQGMFITNTPTFYQFMDSEFPLISVHNFLDIVKDGNINPPLIFRN